MHLRLMPLNCLITNFIAPSYEGSTLVFSTEMSSNDILPYQQSVIFVSRKTYEFSDHLGNVSATISDRKITIAVSAGNAVASYAPDVLSQQDYFPFSAALSICGSEWLAMRTLSEVVNDSAISIVFTSNLDQRVEVGMGMLGRSVTAEGYRYGYQNQEEDDELWGGAVSYKYRIEDPRLGRFFSVDPLAPKYPFYTPYQFSGNRLIDRIELEGLEPAPPSMYFIAEGLRQYFDAMASSLSFQFGAYQKDTGGPVETKTSVGVATDFSEIFDYYGNDWIPPYLPCIYLFQTQETKLVLNGTGPIAPGVQAGVKTETDANGETQVSGVIQFGLKFDNVEAAAELSATGSNDDNFTLKGEVVLEVPSGQNSSVGVDASVSLSTQKQKRLPPLNMNTQQPQPQHQKREREMEFPLQCSPDALYVAPSPPLKTPIIIK
jgi:hypothetical protein